MLGVTVKVEMWCSRCENGYYQELSTPENPRRWDKRGRVTLPRVFTEHDCPGDAIQARPVVSSTPREASE